MRGSRIADKIAKQNKFEEKLKEIYEKKVKDNGTEERQRETKKV
jgi:hypothetical protein